jgi:small-conductance mechanosensitive channel
LDQRGQMPLLDSLQLQGLTLDQQELLIAAALVALAIVGAWLVGRLVGVRLENWLEAKAHNLLGGFTGRVCSLTRYAAAAILLAAFTGLAPVVGAWGRVVLVVALGFAVALLVFQLARGFRLGPAFATLLALALGVALVAGRLGGLDPLVAGLDRAAVSFGKTRVSVLDVLNVALIAALLFGIVRVAVRVLNRSIGNVQSLDLSQRVLFQKLASIAVVAVAFFVGIDVLGIDLTALAVFSGAFGLAVGFGFQKTFGNLISGLILLMDRSIKPGDVIVVGDTFGWVNKIGVRAVSVLTRDGKEHLIPNEKLMTEPVENWSYSDRNVRVHLGVGVSYESDLRLAQALMIQAAKENDRVLADPAPVSWIVEFADSSVNFDLRFWIDDPEKGIANVKGNVMMRIWDLFKENGVEFPFPQQDIHIKSLPSPLSP